MAGLRDFQCSFLGCDKWFLRKTDVTRHLKVHNPSAKTFKCDVPGCIKAFLQRSALKIHQRTHTGEKPNHCPWDGCGKKFNDSSSLSRHRKTHERLTPFPCSIRPCTMHFSTRILLVEHERTHIYAAPETPESLAVSPQSSPIRSVPIQPLLSPSVPFFAFPNISNQSTKEFDCRYTGIGDFTPHFEIATLPSMNQNIRRELPNEFDSQASDLTDYTASTGLDHDDSLTSLLAEQPFDLRQREKVKECSPRDDKLVIEDETKVLIEAQRQHQLNGQRGLRQGDYGMGDYSAMISASQEVSLLQATHPFEEYSPDSDSYQTSGKRQRMETAIYQYPDYADMFTPLLTGSLTDYFSEY